MFVVSVSKCGSCSEMRNLERNMLECSTVKFFFVSKFLYIYNRVICKLSSISFLYNLHHTFNLGSINSLHILYMSCTMVNHGVHMVYLLSCTMVYTLCVCGVRMVYHSLCMVYRGVLWCALGVQEHLNTSYLSDCHQGNDITASFSVWCRFMSLFLTFQPLSGCLV